MLSQAKKKTPAKKKASAKKKAPAKKKARAKTPAKKSKKKKVALDEFPRFVVDRILDVRKNGRKNEYLVSWKGYPDSDNTWELGVDMRKDGHGNAIRIFEKERKACSKKEVPINTGNNKATKKSYNRARSWRDEAQKYKIYAKIEALTNEKETLQIGWLDYEKYEKIEQLTKEIEKLLINIKNK